MEATATAAELDRRREAAASTRRSVEQPRTTLIKQVLAAGSELGATAILRLLRDLGDVKERVPLEEEEEQTDGEEDGEGISEGITGGTLRLGEAAEGSVLEEGAHWLAYASAAYEPTVAALVGALRELGVPGAAPELVLHAQLAPLPLLQPHFVMRDPAKRAIVVAIRGTCSLRDLVADMAARPIPFAGGAAHTGMAAAVDGLLHYRIPTSKDAARAQKAAVVTRVDPRATVSAVEDGGG
jgi:hypothetical protein